MLLKDFNTLYASKIAASVVFEDFIFLTAIHIYFRRLKNASIKKKKFAYKAFILFCLNLFACKEQIGNLPECGDTVNMEEQRYWKFNIL